MSSISSLNSYSASSDYSAAFRMQKPKLPSAEEMVSDLFSKLDTTGKGYIEQSDLEKALSSTGSSTSSSNSAAGDLFSQLDSDSDGKVTKDELTSTLSQLAEKLDNQFNQSRMQNAMGAMPAPPPPQSDSGFTQDELKQHLSEIDSSDSQRASLLNNIVQNFDAADTDGDGKVSFQEARVYDQSTTSSSGTSSSDSSSGTSRSTETSDARIFRQLMELLRTYGGGQSSDSMASSVISTSA
jgi:Ca2+-binding EF-hand superfamily protein